MNQFGLCLCCGAPWLPDIEGIILPNKDASIALLYLENETRNCEDLKLLLVDNKQPHGAPVTPCSRVKGSD
jgi:hypothetical protein